MRFLAPLFAVFALLAPASASAQIIPRVWAIALPNKGDAVLRFAFADTKDLMLAFTCAKGSGQVQIFAASPVRLTEPIDPDAPPATPIAVRRPATIAVTSGAASANLPGYVAPDMTYGGSSITTEISTSSPVIAAFRKSLLLRVSALGDTVGSAPVPTGMLRAFLRYCG